MRGSGRLRRERSGTADAPNTHFEPRRALVDIRLSKVFSLGAGRNLGANFDVYNLFNESAVLTINNTYGPSWLRPAGGTGTSLTTGRLLQFGGQLRF